MRQKNNPSVDKNRIKFVVSSVNCYFINMFVSYFSLFFSFFLFLLLLFFDKSRLFQSRYSRYFYLLLDLSVPHSFRIGCASKAEPDILFLVSWDVSLASLRLLTITALRVQCSAACLWLRNQMDRFMKLPYQLSLLSCSDTEAVLLWHQHGYNLYLSVNGIRYTVGINVIL